MRYLLTFLLIAFSINAGAEPKTHSWQFLLPGDYHGDEAPKNSGKGWLALTRVDGQWHLVQAELIAQRIHDSVLDADDQKTGIRIKSSDQKAIAYIRNSRIKPGKIDTPNMSFKDRHRKLSNRHSIEIPFKNESHQVEVRRGDVFLRKKNELTKLAGIVVGGPESDDSASILWAGDLDGDGALDILMSYVRYNQGGACLYLSSIAPQGKLVKKFDCHSGVGC